MEAPATDFSKIDAAVREAIDASQDRVEFWCCLTRRLGWRSLCEVGVWKGEFAQKLLERNEQIESYTLVDPWRNLPDWNKPANRTDEEFQGIFQEAMVRLAPFAKKLKVIRNRTIAAASEIEDGSLDFAYIDGDHTLRGITIDLHVMVAKVRRFGFIGGDDFTKSIWQHGPDYSPSEIFPYAIYFAEANGLRIYTLPFNQFLIVNSGDGFHIADHGSYASLTPRQIYAP